MIRWTAAAALGMLALLVAVAARAETAPPSLEQWRSERAAFALALTEPIAICVQNHDTENPVFHGCIDWHSSVHGTWALTAYSWATGDHRYAPLIKSLLDPAALKAERAHLAADPTFEMPYGRAWFLRLAIDYHRMFHDGRIDALADDIAASLMARYAQTPPDPKSIAYQSATWALINLYDYGAMKGDTHILDFVRENVRVIICRKRHARCRRWRSTPKSSWRCARIGRGWCQKYCRAMNSKRGWLSFCRKV